MPGEPAPPPVTITDPQRPARVVVGPPPPPPPPPDRRRALLALGLVLTVLATATAVSAARDARARAAALRREARDLSLQVADAPVVTTRLDGRGGVRLVAELAVVSQSDLRVSLLAAAVPGWALADRAPLVLPPGGGTTVHLTRDVPCARPPQLVPLTVVALRAQARGGPVVSRQVALQGTDLTQPLAEACGTLPAGQGISADLGLVRRVGDTLRATLTVTNSSVRPEVLRALGTSGASVSGAPLPLVLPGRRLGGPLVVRRTDLTVRVTDCAGALDPGHDGPGLLVLGLGSGEQGFLPGGTWRALLRTLIQKRCGPGNPSYG